MTLETSFGSDTQFSKARIEMLCDGVFAIAMTLLVLEESLAFLIIFDGSMFSAAYARRPDGTPLASMARVGDDAKMTPVQSAQRKVTYTDLESWPDDGRRYELYDGEVYVCPAPICPGIRSRCSSSLITCGSMRRKREG
ncbi:MAG: DUF1211 domain-containing protein [Acidobacteria bacterium]|nr:DUF1211 domain-containing protein [Acidobacteriota bacterium]